VLCEQGDRLMRDSVRALFATGIALKARQPQARGADRRDAALVLRGHGCENACKSACSL
jgi:hypothetical protein